MSIRVSSPTPCYCSICDAPEALLVRWRHEKNGFEHIEDTLALCEKHAEQMSSVLLQRVRARRNARYAR